VIGASGRRVLVAPDSFKGTLSAAAVTAAIVAGLDRAGVVSDACPLADGGEGTAEVLVGALGGQLIGATASDPLGRAIRASFALLADGSTAVVDVAAASGLAVVAEDERDPLRASTRGTGELVLAALDAGARRVLVAAGGSAATDGGLGAIEAIRVGGGLGGAQLEVLCDTDEPFERAATVFAAQKGAGAKAVAELDRRLAALARELPRDPRGRPRTGAAGGLAGGLWAALNAELSSGAERVLTAVDAPARIAAAALVVSGEGSLDTQSLRGKLVGRLAALCAEIGRPLVVIAGRVELTEQERLAASISRAWEAQSAAEIEAVARGNLAVADTRELLRASGRER
jgi:glycerate 2-kinase